MEHKIRTAVANGGSDGLGVRNVDRQIVVQDRIALRFGVYIQPDDGAAAFRGQPTR
jgi:hypothetical protein